MISSDTVMLPRDIDVMHVDVHVLKEISRDRSTLCYGTAYGTKSPTMGKRERLLAKARSSPQNLRFEELCSLAEMFGFQFARQKGTSHRQYKLAKFRRTMNFQRGRHGEAIAYQVRQLIEALVEIGEIDEEDE